MLLLQRLAAQATICRFEGEAPSNLEGQGYPLAVVLRAWAPYLVLAVFVFFWGLGSFKAILNGLPGTVFNISWPGLDGEVMKTAPIVQADAVYGAKFTFNWLSAGGTAILLSGLVSVPFMPKYGYGKAIACFMRTLKQLTFPILTIAMILGLAYLMNYSGMSSTLGLAFTHTGWLFPFFSPLLGWLGVFLTGSDTSSCALFGGMQKDTALAVGMRPRTGRGLQRLRWRDRQDDLAPVPVRGYRRHRQCRSGRQALPLHHRSQHRHDPGALRAGLPAGWSPFLDAALTGMAQA